MLLNELQNNKFLSFPPRFQLDPLSTTISDTHLTHTMTHTNVGILPPIITSLLGYTHSGLIKKTAADKAYRLYSRVQNSVSSKLDVLSVLTDYSKEILKISSSLFFTLLFSFIYRSQNVLSMMAHTVGMAHSLLHEFITFKTTTL
jgi:hypothetical protein